MPFLFLSIKIFCHISRSIYFCQRKKVAIFLEKLSATDFTYKLLQFYISHPDNDIPLYALVDSGLTYSYLREGLNVCVGKRSL